MKMIRDTILISLALFGACIFIAALGWVGALVAASVVVVNQLLKMEKDHGSSL